MTTLAVHLHLPQNLLGALDVPESELESQILELLALELFRQNRISAGKAAELLGISKWQFIQLLSRHNIPYLTISPSELETEIKLAQSIIGEV